VRDRIREIGPQDARRLTWLFVLALIVGVLVALATGNGYAAVTLPLAFFMGAGIGVMMGVHL
jgi:hypothetical protein